MARKKTASASSDDGLHTVRIVWRPGARFKVSAEVAKREIDKIARLRKDEKFVAAKLVEVAKAPRHPLHRAFNWNDKRAAQLHREEVARSMIRSIHVYYAEMPDTPVRAYQITRPERQPDERLAHCYVNTQRAMSDADLQDYLMQQALSELRWFRRKYSALKQLSKVMRAIDGILGEEDED